MRLSNAKPKRRRGRYTFEQLVAGIEPERREWTAIRSFEPCASLRSKGGCSGLLETRAIAVLERHVAFWGDQLFLALFSGRMAWHSKMARSTSPNLTNDTLSETFSRPEERETLTRLHYFVFSSARLTHSTSLGWQAMPMLEQLKFSPD